MTVLIENEYPAEKAEKIFDFDLQETAELVMETFLDEEQCPYEASVSITITDDGAIREINREHRGIDRPTDVLSFPMFDEDFGDGEDAILGDIVLSLEKAVEQAEAYGHSLRREIAFLTVHSVLHLLGYDHEEGKAEESEMFSRQEAILTILKLTR